MKPIYSCYTFQTVNNKDADQTVHMHRLICIFVVHKEQIAGFLRLWLRYVFIIYAS